MSRVSFLSKTIRKSGAKGPVFSAEAAVFRGAAQLKDPIEAIVIGPVDKKQQGSRDF